MTAESIVLLFPALALLHWTDEKLFAKEGIDNNVFGRELRERQRPETWEILFLSLPLSLSLSHIHTRTLTARETMEGQKSLADEDMSIFFCIRARARVCVLSFA